MKLYHKDDREYNNSGFVREHICSARDFQCDMILLSPGQSISPRVHRLKEEVCFLLDGELDVVVDGEKISLYPGDVLQIEQGEIHSFQNICDGMARMILISTKINLSDIVEL